MDRDQPYRLVQKYEFISRSINNSVHWFNFFPPRRLAMADPSVIAGTIDFDRIADFYCDKVLPIPEAGCMIVEDCFIVGYGLVEKGGNILADRELTMPREEIGAFGYFKEARVDGDNFKLGRSYYTSNELDTAVLLIRRGDNVHGHWLLEILPKVPLAQRVADSSAVYVVSATTPSYQIEMLSALGIPGDKIVKIGEYETVKCKKLIVPSVAHVNQYWLNPFANIVYDRLIESVIGDDLAAGEGAAASKVFITRSSRARDPRPVVDNDLVEDVASEMGYTIIDPGTVGWKKQIKIFHAATLVAGYGGSGLHNTVFTGSNSSVLTIQSNQTFNYLQTSIATIRGHKIGYLYGEALDGFNAKSWETAFKVDERLLRLILERLL